MTTSRGLAALRGRSMSWRFSAFDVEFAELRAASKAVGGSLNDAFLAALLGAFRRYHEELGSSVERMPIAVPISLRAAGDAAGGNRSSPPGSRLPPGSPTPRSASGRSAR